MKKIMITVAAVAVAAFAQAASIDWSIGKNQWTLASGDPAPLGTTVYLINAANLATITSAIEGGTFSAGTVGVLGSGVTANAKGSVAELTTTHDSLVGGTSYNFSALIIDGDKYMVSASIAKNAYIVGTDEPLSIAFDATKFGTNALTYSAANPSGWATTTAAPEPTSGLLILLGMAGLALKRKRA